MNNQPTQIADPAHFGPQVKFYGGKAAVCFQSSMLKDQIPSINIEVAGIVNNEAQWANKLNIQLSENELPLFCGLLLGFLPKLDIRRGNKGVEMVRQKRDANNHPGLYIYASSGRERQFRLLLPTGLMAKVCVLAITQLAKELGADMPVVSAAVRSACSLHI